MLELIFAVKAWRKGWRWRALIPVAFGNLVLFALLVADADPATLLLPILAELVSLGWMAFVAPQATVASIAKRPATVAGR